jgi:hypothetical protein
MMDTEEAEAQAGAEEEEQDIKEVADTTYNTHNKPRFPHYHPSTAHQSVNSKAMRRYYQKGKA